MQCIISYYHCNTQHFLHLTRIIIINVKEKITIEENYSDHTEL